MTSPEQAPKPRPTEQEVEAAYEAHRKTLPSDNGAKPWAEADWGLKQHWRYYHGREAGE